MGSLKVLEQQGAVSGRTWYPATVAIGVGRKVGVRVGVLCSDANNYFTRLLHTYDTGIDPVSSLSNHGDTVHFEQTNSAHKSILIVLKQCKKTTRPIF
jgi:hypothetical protein